MLVVAIRPVGVDPSAGKHLSPCGIEYRGLRRPEFRRHHLHLLDDFPVQHLAGVSLLGHLVSSGIEYAGTQGDCFLTVKSVDRGTDCDVGIFIADKRSRNVCPPDRYAYLRNRDVPDLAVETRSGIPAGRLRTVFQEDFEKVVSLLEGGGHIAPEGVVAVGPEADLHAIDEDAGFAHRSVE